MGVQEGLGAVPPPPAGQRFINLNYREDYLGKGGSSDWALAISIWESPHASRCQYEVWSRPLE